MPTPIQLPPTPFISSLILAPYSDDTNYYHLTLNCTSSDTSPVSITLYKSGNNTPIPFVVSIYSIVGSDYQSATAYSYNSIAAISVGSTIRFTNSTSYISTYTVTDVNFASKYFKFNTNGGSGTETTQNMTAEIATPGIYNIANFDFYLSKIVHSGEKYSIVAYPTSSGPVYSQSVYYTFPYEVFTNLNITQDGLTILTSWEYSDILDGSGPSAELHIYSQYLNQTPTLVNHDYNAISIYSYSNAIRGLSYKVYIIPVNGVQTLISDPVYIPIVKITNLVGSIVSPGIPILTWNTDIPSTTYILKIYNLNSELQNTLTITSGGDYPSYIYQLIGLTLGQGYYVTLLPSNTYSAITPYISNTISFVPTITSYDFNGTSTQLSLNWNIDIPDSVNVSFYQIDLTNITTLLQTSTVPSGTLITHISGTYISGYTYYATLTPTHSTTTLTTNSVSKFTISATSVTLLGTTSSPLNVLPRLTFVLTSPSVCTVKFYSNSSYTTLLSVVGPSVFNSGANTVNYNGTNITPINGTKIFVRILNSDRTALVELTDFITYSACLISNIIGTNGQAVIILSRSIPTALTYNYAITNLLGNYASLNNTSYIGNWSQKINGWNVSYSSNLLTYTYPFGINISSAFGFNSGVGVTITDFSTTGFNVSATIIAITTVTTTNDSFTISHSSLTPTTGTGGSVKITSVNNIFVIPSSINSIYNTSDGGNLTIVS